MPQGLARILYAVEFLVALMAALTLWSQAGGQYHLDLMPWYWKVSLPSFAAFTFTQLTICWAEPNFVKRRFAAWLLALAAIIVCAGTVTYYYHLYEPQETDETTDENTVTRFELPHLGGQPVSKSEVTVSRPRQSTYGYARKLFRVPSES